MGQLNEDLQIYRLYEQQLMHKRVRLLSKLPEIEKALSAVRMVMDKHAEGNDVRGRGAYRWWMQMVDADTASCTHRW